MNPDPLHLPLGELKGNPQQDEPRPSWRGWIHTGILPFVVAGGVLLIVFAEGGAAKAGAAIYLASSILLFGNSALYHRFNWRPRAKRVLKRIDHANIFLLIAGTYTPLSISALTADKGLTLLIVVWVIALFGVLFRVFWVGAPRWLYVPIYLAMGWVAVFYMVDLYQASAAMMILVIAGGLCYTFGAIIYGLKKPNPIPNHFGFHEIFHALTAVAFVCHWAAAMLIATAPVPGSLAG